MGLNDDIIWKQSMSHKTNKNQKKIIKKSGEQEIFNPKKLCDSMVKIGASEDLSNKVCEIVFQSIDSGVSTDKIFTTTRRYLANFDPKLAGLYSLERGLSALGPSGFLFEQYVGGLLQELGYKVQTNVFLEGEAVSHEIDVFASKGNVSYIIEAKYRNDFKSRTHINQIMYADARLGDIKRQAAKKGDTREYFMWVVTNTEFTDAAISYVHHRDLQLMGWSYPRYINLMKIVYEKKLYPVTVLPSISKNILRKMSGHKQILVSQLAKFSIEALQEMYNISNTLASKIYNEVQQLV
jgi:hypothetical protein